MVLRVTISLAHNTLEFPQLLFKVLVRFGPGECFRNLLLDCVLRAYGRSCVKDFPLTSSSGFGFLRPGGPRWRNDRLGVLSIIHIDASAGRVPVCELMPEDRR